MKIYEYRDLEEIHKNALPVYIKASEFALKAYRHPISFDLKNVSGNVSVVTKVDKYLDKLFRKELISLIPGAGILSEEGKASLKDEYNWIVDPLDGSANFQRGVDLWGMFISLKHKQETVYACMIFPTLMTKLIYAFKGKDVLDDSGNKLTMGKSDGYKIKFSADSSDPIFKKNISALNFDFKISYMSTGSVAFNAYSLVKSGYDFMIMHKLPIHDLDSVKFIAGQMGFTIHFFGEEKDILDDRSNNYRYTILISKPDIYDRILPKLKDYIENYDK